MVYFILVILEGALRKWILPGLSTPILIIRDPIATWLIFYGYRRGVVKFNFYTLIMTLVAVVSIFLGLFLGHGNLLVALFGARILLIYFPFIFVIGSVFNRDDVVKIGRICLWISIPMTLLISIQFYSPQTAWVNRGVGTDPIGAGFSGALGYFRPPGTFSFTNGTALFYSLCAPFLFYFWLSSQMNKVALIIISMSIILAIPLSISRSLFYSVIVCLIFAIFGILRIFRDPKYIIGLLICAFAFVFFWNFLEEAKFSRLSIQAFSTRLETANNQEGGIKGVIGDRYFGDMFESLKSASSIPFFGFGIGMGTNAGAAILTGEKKFLISEGEWGRLTGEMGLLLGLSVIFLRLSLSLKLFFSAYRKLVSGDILPWLLISITLLQLPQGQWAQPTNLGFATLMAGFVIASLKRTEIIDENII